MKTVQTTVFAPPQRAENARWHNFFSEPGISLQAIARSKRGEGEVNDIAMERQLRELATSRDVSLSLLTADTDFVGVVRSIITLGLNVSIFVPARAVSAIRQYELAGARVVPLSGRESEGSKIRAILHPDGSGTVEMADPWAVSVCDPTQLQELDRFGAI